MASGVLSEFYIDVLGRRRVWIWDYGEPGRCLGESVVGAGVGYGVCVGGGGGGGGFEIWSGAVVSDCFGGGVAG